jgi:hypothetical protein
MVQRVSIRTTDGRWRRYLGIALLAVDSAFTVAWMRSYVVADQLCTRIGANTYEFVSVNAKLTWKSWGPGTYTIPSDFWRTDTATPEWKPELRKPHFGNSIDIEWSLGEFQFGRQFDHTRFADFMYCTVPYWSFVMLMAALCAWLILGRSRPAPPDIVVNAPEIGGNE